jgi:c(7)-type cytochrome triheme protein
MLRRFLLMAVALLAAPAWAQPAGAGKAVYDKACAACHGTGLLGAPKPGDAAAWTARARGGGVAALLKSAQAGTAKGMPPRGGRPDLADADLRAAIEFMAGAALAAPAPVAAAASTAPATTTPTATAAATTAATPPAATPTPVVAAARAEVNAFNRLLKPPPRIHRPAADSGIHDPLNDMTAQLQPPALALGPLPRSIAGNHVDWVKALDGKAIAPRWDRQDAAAAAIVMDLNIVREVKGSMPDVVYPHKQHTEWLDCSNCHPAIFVPQKGANQISMASILLGRQCGVCHGKVAFPVSECRLCHSRKKTVTTVAGEARP